MDELEFDVALSFADENRSYVEEVASTLVKMNIRVFYDKYESVSLWGKDLYTHLSEVYFKRAKCVVMFLSIHFKEKLWTNHEREAAQARAFEEKKEYILPARFDDTQIPGILPTTGYVNLNKYTPSEFAELIKQKIGPISRCEFFPNDPDMLYSYFDLESESEKEEVLILAQHFFEILKLMTPQERNILSIACENSCPYGFPENVHLNLEYLSRLTDTSVDDLLGVFSRLDCLSIKSRLYESQMHKIPDALVKSIQMIEFEFLPGLVDISENGTYVMIAIFDTIRDYLCPSCRQRTLMDVDLSILSKDTGYPDNE